MFLLSDCPLPFIMKGEIRMAIHKALKDLNLLDRFLFAEAMEDPEMPLEDGAVRIFLNTRGKDRTGVPEELMELLHYIEHTTEEVSNSCKSGKIRELQSRIARIKSSEEIGVKYMQEWEEKIIETRRAREEGLAEGRAEGREYHLFTQVRRKIARGCSAAEIAEMLEEDPAHVQKMYDFLVTKMDGTEEESWAAWSGLQG